MGVRFVHVVLAGLDVRFISTDWYSFCFIHVGLSVCLVLLQMSLSVHLILNFQSFLVHMAIIIMLICCSC